jgi:hypothetical protein
MVKKQDTVDSVELNVTDVAIAIQIIDLASEKGLFKGGDLKPVGEARERLVEWVKANAPEQESETETANS